MATEEHLETAQDDDYDPFAVFDHAQGAGQVRDPYPVFAELRRQAPIHQGGLWSFFDSENTILASKPVAPIAFPCGRAPGGVRYSVRSARTIAGPWNNNTAGGRFLGPVETIAAMAAACRSGASTLTTLTWVARVR